MCSFGEQEMTLLQRCRNGSREAFEGIVKRYMKDAYFIAFGLVGNRDDALDLSQEAFVRAYCNIGQRNEDKDRVWQAIGQLNDKHREVIILRHFQQLTYDQIAEALFCSKGTVMSRLYYARSQLKQILNAEKGGQQE